MSSSSASSSSAATSSTTTSSTKSASIETVVVSAAAKDADDKKSDEKDLAYIASLIKAYPDYPSKGVLFRDVFGVFKDPVAVSMLLCRMQKHIQSTFGKVDVIVGLDSRGFLFGPSLSMGLGAAFVPIRKKNKLPGTCLRISYTKEYGSDEFDIQADAIKKGQKCIIVDDLLATGGTMRGAIDLVQALGGEVLECHVVIELEGLKGSKKVSPVPVWGVLKF